MLNFSLGIILTCPKPKKVAIICQYLYVGTFACIQGHYYVLEINILSPSIMTYLSGLITIAINLLRKGHFEILSTIQKLGNLPSLFHQFYFFPK